MEILGVKIDNLDKEEISNKLAELLNNGQQHYAVLPYSLFLVESGKDRYFKEILNDASLSISDGVGPVLAARFLTGEKLKRLSGIDFINLLCQLAEKKQHKVFLYGAKEGIAEIVSCLLKEKYSNLNVAGVCPGFNQETQSVVGLINQSQAEILFIALGMPKQEKWITENLSKMPSVKLAVGVGGAFNFISGRIRRAPRLVQAAGLEWLWRFCLEPWRFQRMTRATVVFPWLVLKSKFKR